VPACEQCLQSRKVLLHRSPNLLQQTYVKLRLHGFALNGVTLPNFYRKEEKSPKKERKEKEKKT
jgi:hypothetical protein